MEHINDPQLKLLSEYLKSIESIKSFYETLAAFKDFNQDESDKVFKSMTMISTVMLERIKQ